jgi:polysaccharide pyruvyl transferase WcaK-like protein
MISGLSTCTPTVVVGWSHKYREVLDDFGLAEFGMDSSVLSSPSEIVAQVQRCIADKPRIAMQIREALPAVKERSALNFSIIAGVAKS